MPDKRVLIKTKDFNMLEEAIGFLEHGFTTLSVIVSRMRIEDNEFNMVLSLKGDNDDICKAVMFLKNSPSMRLEEI